MAYLGVTPAVGYSKVEKQTITGNGGTTYTLTYPVGNEQEIEVYVNNVRQEPGVAYTTFGTTLTMTGVVTVSDSFYVVYQGKSEQIGSIIPEKDDRGNYNFDGGTLFIDSGNNEVGIGTTTPTSNLHVIGTANVTTALTVGNTTVTTTGIQIQNQPAYALANIVYLTSGTNVTYTPPVSTRAFYVEVVGGGGGGGGVDGIAASLALGASGGGGGYSAVFITNLNQTFKYTVGAGGTGGAAGANAGSTGGTSFFYGGASGTTVLAQATGGSGGNGMTGTSGTSAASGGNGGDGAIGTLNLSGRRAVTTRVISGTTACPSLSGAAPFFGGGSFSQSAGNGTNATNFGEGGTNAVSTTDSNFAGGNGFAGVIRITEFY